MKQTNSLTEGNITKSLLLFAFPVMLSRLLQSLYGAVDLLVVGQFAATADVSGVATGSSLMATFMSLVMGLSMGITILVARKIGERRPEEAGAVVGSGICLFLVFSAIMTAVLALGAPMLAGFMNAPEEAFAQTVSYVRICGIGTVFIVGYNVLGSIFRGIGDSKTPLMSVVFACIANILGDLLFVAVLGMGAAGAALATMLSQGISVLLSILVIRKRQLPFTLTRQQLRFDRKLIGDELRVGTPIALQDLLVGMSFLIIQMIVNSISLTASASVGVSEKICGFIMLVPSAYMQTMSAFVAQNLGAGKPDRAKKALISGILTSFVAGVIMSIVSFFWGDWLCRFFSSDAAVVASAHSYLKAYAIDCLLTPFMFCSIGYFNGCEKTLFVMLQGIAGAFGVRVPVVFLMSRIPNASLFQIGLGTPASSAFQIFLCILMFIHMNRKKAKTELSH